MKILKFRFESVSPLLQHDDKMANPFNDYTKRMKAISSKRKKTDDDLMEMARIEWMASLYHTERKGYYMKAECSKPPCWLRQRIRNWVKRFRRP